MAPASGRVPGTDRHRAVLAEAAMGLPTGVTLRTIDGPERVPPPRTAIILAGGLGEHVEVPPGLGPDPLVVAADSGVHLAQRLDLPIDLVVGDLDSVLPEALARARDAGAVVEVHPTDKDASDLELAIEAAIRHPGVDRLVVLGLHGGRIDHHLANVLLLASARWRDVHVEAHGAEGLVAVVHDRVVLRAAPGALCTLLAVGGPATGVRTEGLRWPLEGHDLPFGTGWGLSNEFVAPEATISLTGGTLLAIVPEEPGGAGATVAP
jgi:thiamine pyrophosphokinase